MGGSHEMATPHHLHPCLVTYDPFYNMHLVPVKPKAPASYLLNLVPKADLYKRRY